MSSGSIPRIGFDSIRCPRGADMKVDYLDSGLALPELALLCGRSLKALLKSIMDANFRLFCWFSLSFWSMKHAYNNGTAG